MNLKQIYYYLLERKYLKRLIINIRYEKGKQMIYDMISYIFIHIGTYGSCFESNIISRLFIIIDDIPTLFLQCFFKELFNKNIFMKNKTHLS